MSFEFLLHFIDLFFFYRKKIQKNTDLLYIHDPDKLFHTVFTQTEVYY